MGHARALLSLDKADQPAAARKVISDGLTVRDTERLVRRLLQPKQNTQKPTTLDPDIRRLQQSLSERLGARIKIKHTRSGKGQMVIEYSSLDELDGIIDQFK